MNIYISGPLHAPDQDYINQRYREAEAVIKQAGHAPFSPLADSLLPDDAPYSEHLKEDFALLIDSDAVLLLYGWRNVARCRMEYQIALQMGKAIFTSFSNLKQFTASL